MIDLRNKYNMDLPRCRGAYLEDCPPSVWDDVDHVLEPKYDGERLSMQIGAKSSLLISRNRQDFLKGVGRAKEFRNRDDINPELAAIACKELEDTVLDGEVTDLRRQDGSRTLDTLRREECGEFLGYVVWQALFFKGHDCRGLPDSERRFLAKVAIDLLHKHYAKKFPYVKKIKLIQRRPATLKNLNELLDAGWEGGIVKDKTKPLPTDKRGKYQRTNTFWWKVKGEERRTVDAFVVGVNEAMSGGSGVKDVKRIPNGKAATFDMAMVTEDLGDGLHKSRLVAVMFNLPEDAIEYGWKDFEQFRGRVAEMQISGWDGKRFRWPRFVKWRLDKSPQDCRFSEQIGGTAK